MAMFTDPPTGEIPVCSYASGGKCVVFFLDDTLGWVGGDWDTLQLESPARYVTTGILHTTDGLNFIEQYNPVKHGVWAILFINKDEGWAGTYGGELLHTLDGGDHWVIDVNGSFPGKFIRRIIQVKEKQAVYILGNHGLLLKKGGITGIPETTTGCQNLRIYPDPVIRSAVISWQLEENNHVVVKVYDYMGREINTLADDDESKGEHQVIIDASDLTGGIYFCRIRAGNKTGTGKMMVVR